MSNYIPGTPPAGIPPALMAFMRAEQMRLKQSLESAQESFAFAYLHAEPEKIVPGMEVLADGSDWDPGSIGVAAKYRRSEDNTTWELIEATGVAASLAAHLADTSDAHDASAISILDAANDFTATDVEGALAELRSDHEADAQALADHIADATDAHDASAISSVAAGNLSSTNVQSALNELDTEKQPLDAGLTSLAAYDTNGFVVQDATNSFVGRTITGTAGQITLTNGSGVAGNPVISLPADVLVPTVLTVPNVGLHLLDTDASHDLIVKPGSNLSADRTLTVTTGDSDRTLTLTGDASISGTHTGTSSGTNTGDQTSVTGNAGTVTVANEASDTSCFLLFATATSGSLEPKTNANLTLNSSTGVVTFASAVLTTADINGGTVDGAAIGAASASTGKFTTVETTGSVGIGGGISSSNNVSVAGNVTGSTSANAMRMIGTVQSDVTSTARYLQITAATAAASFTVSNLVYFEAAQGTFGASSTVSDQRAFHVPSSLTGATVNYGFYGNLAASGTARWNVYMAGTAPNAFAGTTRFGSTTVAVNTVDITGSFGRGAPVTKTGDFTWAASENWIIVNKGSSCTVTLPTASSFTGREIMLKVITAHTVVSASSNVVPITDTAAGTAILPATDGAWCCLVSDGTNWIVMQRGT